MSANILLVEDNSADATLFIEVLKDAQITNHIELLTDGVDVMSYLLHQAPYTNSQLPHLIILDLNLPKKDGHEVLQEIKSHPTLKSIPVIVFTGSNREEDRIKSFEIGATHYYIKPMLLDEYETLVHKMIEDHIFKRWQ